VTAAELIHKAENAGWRITVSPPIFGSGVRVQASYESWSAWHRNLDPNIALAEAIEGLAWRMADDLGQMARPVEWAFDLFDENGRLAFLREEQAS